MACLDTLDFESRKMQEIWWTATDGWNAAAWRIAWPTRSILRASSESLHPKLAERRYWVTVEYPMAFSGRTASSSIWTARSIPSWLEISKLIFDQLTQRRSATPDDFFGQNRIVFLFMEESSSMTVQVI
jgi:hypothetical protein